MVNKQRQVSLVFAALADPTRRRIMEHISRRGEAQVTLLAEPFHISLPAFSRHLRVLERARLIERKRDGRLHLIRARTGPMKEAQSWITNYVAGWESSFDTLSELIRKERREKKR